MGIVYQKDKRSGITYVYENHSYWDKEKKVPRSKRTLIGRLNEETGEVMPTDGRCKKRSPSYQAGENEYQMPKTMKGMREEILRLLDENEALKDCCKDIRNPRDGKTVYVGSSWRDVVYKDSDGAEHTIS